MKILVSNDDGIYAAGIEALTSVASEFGEVVVIAPDRNRSGASNSLTLTRPLRVKQIMHERYSVEGTPSDCVHLALTGLFDFIPDLIVSGINSGPNMGDDVLYSGTVAAAMEGYNHGIPAVAFSFYDEDSDPNYLTAASVARIIIQQLITKQLPEHALLNVNIPPCTFSDIKGFASTRLGSRAQSGPLTKQQDPRGRDIFWIGRAGPEADAGPGTDFYAIANQQVSITPLHMDLTHYDQLPTITEWMQTLELVKA